MSERGRSWRGDLEVMTRQKVKILNHQVDSKLLERMKGVWITRSHLGKKDFGLRRKMWLNSMNIFPPLYILFGANSYMERILKVASLDEFIIVNAVELLNMKVGNIILTDRAILKYHENILIRNIEEAIPGPGYYDETYPFPEMAERYGFKFADSEPEPRIISRRDLLFRLQRKRDEGVVVICDHHPDWYYARLMGAVFLSFDQRYEADIYISNYVSFVRKMYLKTWPLAINGTNLTKDFMKVKWIDYRKKKPDITRDYFTFPMKLMDKGQFGTDKIGWDMMYYYAYTNEKINPFLGSYSMDYDLLRTHYKMRLAFGWSDDEVVTFRNIAAKAYGFDAIRWSIKMKQKTIDGKIVVTDVSGHLINVLLMCHFVPLCIQRYLEAIRLNAAVNYGSASAVSKLKQALQCGLVHGMSAGAETRTALWHSHIDYMIAVLAYELTRDFLNLGEIKGLTTLVRNHLDKTRTMYSNFANMSENAVSMARRLATRSFSRRA
jgi:hypothetical protein